MPSTKIGYIGSSYLAGWAVSSPLVALYADKKGRKPLFVISLVLQAIFYSVMMFSQSLFLTIGMQFCNGLLTGARINVAFVYLNEFVTKKWQSVLAIIFNVFDGSLALIFTIYFRYIDKHWFYVSSIGLAFNIVAIIGVTFFLTESPLFLLKSNQVARAQTILLSTFKSSDLRTKALIDDLTS